MGARPSTPKPCPNHRKLTDAERQRRQDVGSAESALVRLSQGSLVCMFDDVEGVDEQVNSIASWLGSGSGG